MYEKINSEKGRETMCLKKGGGGVYMRKSIVRWRKRDYMSQQRGGGGVKRRRNILGEVYKSFFVMEPEPKINNFGSATLVIFYTFISGK